MLRLICSEQSEMRSELAEQSTKISIMAQGMVSMRMGINKLDDSVQGLRADVRMIAITVD